MNTRLRSLLDDLYAIDPDLRAEEEQLKPLIEKLLRSKPDVTPDPAFVQHLRTLLQERSAEIDARTMKQETPSFFRFPQLGFGLGGVLVGVFMMISIAPLLPTEKLPTNMEEEGADNALFSTTVISDVGPAAFGDLTQGGAYIQGAVPLGLGGGVENNGASMPSIIPDRRSLPLQQSYTFRLDGELPTLPSETVNVLRRENNLQADASILLNRLHTGLVDLRALSNSQLESISMSQQQPFGLMTNISFRDGTISIHQNWEQWPHPENDCTGTDCQRRTGIAPEDLPDDTALFTIANAFIDELDIDVSEYGAPVVDQSWRTRFEQLAPEAQQQFSLGEVVRVIYPLMIDGKTVVDTMGSPAGISLGVNVQHQRVQEAWGIMDRTYVSSAYPAVNTQAEIEELLTSTSPMPVDILPMDRLQEREEIIIGLGTPTIGLATFASFNDDRPVELLVPSLLFPVTDVPEGAQYERRTVIVPLAQGLQAIGL